MGSNEHSNLEVYDERLPEHKIIVENNIWQEQQNVKPANLPNQRSPPKRWIIYGLAAGLIAFLFATVGVGAGLGTSLANCKDDLASCRSVTPATTPTTTNTTAPANTTDLNNYSVVAAAEVTHLDVDCNTLNSTMSGYKQDTYKITCNLDLASGGDATNLTGTAITLQDITGVNSYTLADCLLACSIYKTRQPASPCLSVTFNPDMAFASNNAGANCWLKNGIVANPQSGDNVAISAQLVL